MSIYAIDVRWMVGEFRGMGRYAWQLVYPIKSKLTALGPADTENINMKSHFVGKNFFPYWEQVVQPKLAKKNKTKYLICPYNTGPLFLSKNIKTVLVVHDLIYMKSFKELKLSISFYQTLGRLYRRFIVPKMINKADHIITVSEYTKNEILKKHSIPTTITVIPNAISDEWLTHSFIPLDKRGNYFLTVTGEAPSKNLIRLLEAYSLYSQKSEENILLKIVGVKPTQQNKFRDIANKLKIDKKVEFINYISNSDLINLYGNAKGFIFASLFEGFGIPLLEAMATGTPIACSNTTSLPEVVGDCGYQFTPLSVVEISKAFIYLGSQSDKLKENVDLGLERVKSYSEHQVNKKINEFWKKIQ